MTSTADVGELTEPVSAREVFIAWERLRVVFNLALIVLVAIFGHDYWSERGFLSYVIKAAFVANVGYCAGPVAEGYLALAGVQRRAARAALFGGGLVIACLFCAMVVIAWPLRELD